MISFDIHKLPSLKGGGDDDNDDNENTPGLTLAEESLQRRKTCRFLEQAGRALRLPRVAVSTAMVFFHRFYSRHSFRDHDRLEVAVACLVLAAKTEESPKKLAVVMEECAKLQLRALQYQQHLQQSRRSSVANTGNLSNVTGASSGSSSGPLGFMNPTGTTHPPTTATETALWAAVGSWDPKSEEFVKRKERILLLERVVLHTIGFDLSIDHPYKFIVDLVKRMVLKRHVTYKETTTTSRSSGDPATGNTATPTTSSSSSQIQSKLMNELVQVAVNFANDSMHTTLCLQFDPQRIGIACVYLACHFVPIRPTMSNSSNSGGTPSSSTSKSSSGSWLDVLGYPDIPSMASIVLQMVEHICTDRPKQAGEDVNNMQNLFTRIRNDLDTLQQQKQQQQQQQQQQHQAPSRVVEQPDNGTLRSNPNNADSLTTRSHNTVGTQSSPTQPPSPSLVISKQEVTRASSSTSDPTKRLAASSLPSSSSTSGKDHVDDEKKSHQATPPRKGNSSNADVDMKKKNTTDPNNVANAIDDDKDQVLDTLPPLSKRARLS